MFIGKYFDWNQKRLKGIIDFYGHQFMVNKSILDLGCGYADISGPLHRLGAQVTALDGRKDHLDIVSKRYPGLKIVKSDLDREWLFAGQKFDLVLDLGLLCHVRDYESHLRNVCSVAQNLVLETAVCDDSDPYKNIILDENKAIYDLSINGKSSRPTAAAIERILSECGMTFQRINNNKFNSGTYKYDWQELNNSECDFNKRRIWFCAKDNAIPIAIPTSPVVDSITQNVPTPIVLSSTNIHISTPVTTVTSQQENTMKVNNIYNNKIKFLLNTFSHKYFLRKTILDAGAGTGDFIAQFSKMGTSIITAIDGRQQNLALIQKKYPTIKTGKTNFEAPLSLNGKYDIVFSIDTLCHISNYEQHLSSLCARSQEFFLETAVCDSNDPNDVFHVKEDNNIHSLSVSGIGSRPSAARIEKILVEKGMSFIRIDNSALNEGNNVYDWQVTNSKNHSAHLRRFWICSKRPQVISEISGKLNLQEKNKNIQSIAQIMTDATPVAEVFSQKPKIHLNNIHKTVNDYKTVLYNSKENAIIRPFNFVTKTKWDLNFSVAPTTFSAKQWVSKIIPYFPNLKIFNKIKNFNSNLTANNIDLSISSKEKILIAKNLFLEEYSGNLEADQILHLSKCDHIITPSLINYQELSNFFKDKKISRLEKIWPYIDSLENEELPQKENYAIYFEKDEKFTPLIVKNFSYLNLNKLFVVGSRCVLPNDVIRVSEYDDYKKILKLISKSSLLIDISNNTNYNSGLINLSKSLDTFIITNNLHYINEDSSFIFIRNEANDDKLSEDNLKFSFLKFKNEPIQKSIVRPNQEFLYSNINKFLGF